MTIMLPMLKSTTNIQANIGTKEYYEKKKQKTKKTNTTYGLDDITIT